MAESKSPIEPERARELLARERQRVEAGLADLARVHDSETDEADTSTDAGEDAALLDETEVDDAVATRLRAELDAIGRAEKRVEEGTYGLSIESGDPIPEGRLEAVPWAER